MKIALSVFVLTLSVFILNAQEENDTNSKQKFIGVWQQCIVNSDIIKIDSISRKVVDVDTINIKTDIVYKYFGKDGDFNSVYISPSKSFVLITGTYEVDSDRYFENVGYHFYTNFSNKRVEIPYTFYGSNYFVMSYINDANSLVFEVWKRLPLYNTVRQ